MLTSQKDSQAIFPLKKTSPDKDGMFIYHERGTKENSESSMGIEPMAGSHEFDSRRGLRIFLCPTLVINEHSIFIIYSPSLKFTIFHYLKLILCLDIHSPERLTLPLLFVAKAMHAECALNFQSR